MTIESAYKEFGGGNAKWKVSMWKQQGDITRIYDEWNEKVMAIKRSCERKPRKKQYIYTVEY